MSVLNVLYLLEQNNMASDTVEKPFIKHIGSILSIRNKNKSSFNFFFKKVTIAYIERLAPGTCYLFISFLTKHHPK